MCEPATLALVAAGVAVAGTGVQALTANAQANYQAKVAEQNAKFKAEDARLEDEATKRHALNHYRQVAQLKGQQVASAAANGVSTDFGTAADAVGDTTMLAREDVDQIYQQGDQNRRGIDIQIANLRSDAAAARSSGRGALVSGAFGMANTALGGVQQYRKLRADMNG